MPLVTAPVTITAGEELALAIPEGQAGQLAQVVVVNASPYPVTAHLAAGEVLMGAGLIDVLPVPSSGQSIKFDVGTNPNVTTGTFTLGATWYFVGEEVPGTYPQTVMPSTIEISGQATVVISGTVPVDIQSGSVSISGTPTVDVNPVTIAGGTVDIGGTVDANISAGSVEVTNPAGQVLVTEGTAPQELLATAAGTSTTETVPLPTNCETIAILLPASYAGTVTVKGATTGRAYPVGSASALAGGDPLYVANVFPKVDSSVTVTLSAAPGASWYVTSDTVVRYTLGAVTGGGSPKASQVSMSVPPATSGWATQVTSQSLTLEGVAAGDDLYVVVGLYGSPPSVTEVSSITSNGNFTWSRVNAAEEDTTGYDADRVEVWKGTGSTPATSVDVTVIYQNTSATTCAIGFSVAGSNGAPSSATAAGDSSATAATDVTVGTGGLVFFACMVGAYAGSGTYVDGLPSLPFLLASETDAYSSANLERLDVAFYEVGANAGTYDAPWSFTDALIWAKVGVGLDT